ncbi:MAG: hypothetical protein Q8K63_07065, partial [Acidimicrobiales bacterium]|nr:hypothetical protein [Acidimicrobiales bacterium]
MALAAMASLTMAACGSDGDSSANSTAATAAATTAALADTAAPADSTVAADTTDAGADTTVAAPSGEPFKIGVVTSMTGNYEVNVEIIDPAMAEEM